MTSLRANSLDRKLGAFAEGDCAKIDLEWKLRRNTLAQLKLAVRTDVMRRPIRQSLELAARMGARAVELDARGEIHPSQLSDTGLRQLRKMLDDRQLGVAALRFFTRRGYENPADLERRVDATKQAMSLAFRLGAPVVVNSIGQVVEDPDDPRWQSMAMVLDDLGRYGTRVGAFLAAETGAESGPTLAKMLDRDDGGFIAVAFNPGQLIVNRFDVGEALDALRGRIQVVHAVDGVLDLAAGRGLSVPVGEGTADFPQLLGKLEEQGFDGPFIVGRDDSETAELAQSIEYLRNL